MGKLPVPPAIVHPDPLHSTLYVTAWQSPSRTHAHVTYSVKYDTLTNEWGCQCPAYHFRGHCAHIEAGLAALANELQSARRASAA